MNGSKLIKQTKRVRALQPLTDGVRAAACGTPCASALLLCGLLLALATACTSSGEPAPATEATPQPITIALGTKRAALVSTALLDVEGDTYVQSTTPNQNRGGNTQLSLQALGKHRTLLFFSAP